MAVVAVDSGAERHPHRPAYGISNDSRCVPSLQHWRVNRAMLQRELAQAVGVELPAIQRLEAGGRAGLDTFRRLAMVLQVDPDELMAWPPDD
jgi:DNA-binding Xre family transcriptional regulator